MSSNRGMITQIQFPVEWQDRFKNEDGSYISLKEYFYMESAETIKEQMDALYDYCTIIPINGCITGSYFLPGFDPEGWGTKPDIDLFVYSERDLITAIVFAQYVMGMTPGTGDSKAENAERWKIQRLMDNGLNKKFGITTYKLHCGKVERNITHKEEIVNGHWCPCNSVSDVLESFDMSIVMQGYDLKSKTKWDMRVGDPLVAIPNPLRSKDCMAWTVKKWIRQFDRVIKYYNRGFDTRPMAVFYREMIDQCLEQGNLFSSDDRERMFAEFASEFKETREVISDWLKSHEED